MVEFDTLSKAMIKFKKVFENNVGIPQFFVRMLCDLEDHVAKSLAEKAAFKKLKPAQGRSPASSFFPMVDLTFQDLGSAHSIQWWSSMSSGTY